MLHIKGEKFPVTLHCIVRYNYTLTLNLIPTITLLLCLTLTLMPQIKCRPTTRLYIDFHKRDVGIGR